jgi:hypothetical protein
MQVLPTWSVIVKLKDYRSNTEMSFAKETKNILQNIAQLSLLRMVFPTEKYSI